MRCSLTSWRPRVDCNDELKKSSNNISIKATASVKAREGNVRDSINRFFLFKQCTVRITVIIIIKTFVCFPTVLIINRLAKFKKNVLKVFFLNKNVVT